MQNKGGNSIIYTKPNYTCFCSSFSETSDSDMEETELAELDWYFLVGLLDFFGFLECFDFFECFDFLELDLEDCFLSSFLDFLCLCFLAVDLLE